MCSNLHIQPRLANLVTLYEVLGGGWSETTTGGPAPVPPGPLATVGIGH